VSLAAREKLDARQVKTAMQFTIAWQALDGIYSRASTERIDVHAIAAFHAEASSEARKHLDRVRGLVGAHAYRLMCRVCGEGFHIRDLYQSRRERETAADILRISLDVIADEAD